MIKKTKRYISHQLDRLSRLKQAMLVRNMMVQTVNSAVDRVQYIVDKMIMQTFHHKSMSLGEMQKYAL